MKNKLLVIGIVLILLLGLSTGKSTDITKLKENDDHFSNNKTKNETIDNDEKVKIACSINFPSCFMQDESKPGLSLQLYEIEIAKNKAEKIKKDLKYLNEQIAKTKDTKQREKLINQQFDILKNEELLPRSLNFNSILELSNDFSNYFIKNDLKETIENQIPKRNQGKSIHCLGPSLLAFVTVLGSVSTLGFSGVGFGSQKIIPLQEILIKINKTGIHFFFINNPNLQTIHINISASFWTDLWNNIGNFSDGQAKDPRINVTSYGGWGLFYGQFIFGRAIANGFIWRLLTNPSELRRIGGSFFYAGFLTLPIDITVYQTWPKPEFVLLDLGIVPSIFGATYTPFWYEDNGD